MARCCSNCVSQVKIVGHPWNDPAKFTNGSVTDVKCYGCAVEPGMVILFDKPTGLCELHEYKKSE